MGHEHVGHAVRAGTDHCGAQSIVWHEIIDTVIEGPPRTTADEIANYLARHQYDLTPTLRIELERRHVCV